MVQGTGFHLGLGTWRRQHLLPYGHPNNTGMEGPLRLSLKVTQQINNMAGGLARSAWLLLPPPPAAPLCGPHCSQECSQGVGGRKEVTPAEPARSKIQGQRLQVHSPEAFNLLWQVPTKDPQIKNTKKSVKAVTSGPGSHKDRSPWQASSSSLLPSILPWLLSCCNKFSHLGQAELLFLMALLNGRGSQGLLSTASP